MTVAPVVSVVTPVYNGAQYLEECMQSILCQTYSDWEYVIVDNVSTDTTVEIAERFAAQDARIRVVRATEFVPALDSHNRAMRVMDPDSRYCKVLHADDWLYPDCLERMVALAERHPSVGVVSSFRLDGNRVQQVSPLPYPHEFIPGHELVRWELLGPKGPFWATGSPTTLLLRADLVRQAKEFYDPTVWHSDTDAAYRVLMQSDFGFVHQVLTCTRRHSGALMSYSHRVWSFSTRDGRLLMRYGPQILNPSDYQAKLRQWLGQYGLWLAKQALKPSRHGQQEFHDFHQREIDYLMIEVGQDRAARVLLSSYRRLLHASRRPSHAPPSGPVM